MLKLLVLSLFFTSHLYANEEGAYLDPPYENHVHPINDLSLFKSQVNKNNVESVISFQTSVKSQGKRGTCSIFSAAALLESLLVNKGDFEKSSIDLSEEWLQYLVTYHKTTDGSNSRANFNAIKKYGMPLEKTLPYIGETWKEGFSSIKKEERCGHLLGTIQEQCFVSHFDPALINMTDVEILDESKPTFFPEFVAARSEAAEFRDQFIKFKSDSYFYSVYSQSQIKKNLQQGIPMTLGISFYYGAWNHSKAPSLEIHRNMKNWSEGIVGYPEPDSMDRVNSLKARAGHSVVVVGYDDNLIVSTEYKDKNGEIKTKEYKGVYFFKNSWGTHSFGTNTLINGTARPGYGIITQKYAHEMGTFYAMPLE